MPDRILVVQLADIGDLVLSTPALAALREARPDAQVALLTTAHAAPIIEGTGLTDELILFPKHIFDSPRALLNPANVRLAMRLARQLRQGRYSTIVFFHHFTTRFGAFKFAALSVASGSRQRLGLDNGNGFFLSERLTDEGFGARHQAQYWLDLVARLGADPSPRSAVVAVDPSVAETLPSPATGESGKDSLRVAIHPGSGGYSLARRWDAARFAAVADALHKDYGAQIVLVGGPNDDTDDVRAAMRATTPIDLTGKTTLPQLAGVLRTCDLFIGSDSGVMHVAAAAGTPVVAIFGPSNPDAWGPWTPDGRSAVVSSAPECAPCSYVGHKIGLREGSEARTCMKMVTHIQVLQAARALLEGRDVPPPQYKHKRLSSPASVDRLTILGVPVDAITYEAWLNRIDEWVQDRAATQPRHVCTVNPEFIMIARQDTNFHDILNRADLCIPDGVGLLWAARHLGRPLPERVTGSDGVPKIAERAAVEGWRLFLLGAAPGVAERAADVLMKRHPGLRIVGAYPGSPAPYEEDELVEQINSSHADILFVAYGAPVQDKWIARNLPRLRVKMAMGVGGSLDFIAGVVPRAPLWMQRLGLEWLFRLIRQPWRIRRMLRLPRFVLAVLTQSDRPAR